MKIPAVFISSVILAIIVQNTCPFGLASKTAFASPYSNHCPLKGHDHEESGRHDGIDKDPSHANSYYVLHVAETDSALHGPTLNKGMIPPGLNTYKDACPDPPLRPPRA